MTLQNRKMYLGAILAVTLVAGLSGVLQAEAVTHGMDTQRYETCEEKTKNGKTKAKKTYGIMMIKFGVWEQNGNNDKQYYHEKWDFPSTIYKLKPGILGHATCEPVRELYSLKYAVMGESTITNDHTQVCANYDYYDSTNSQYMLREGHAKFPSTNGMIEEHCKATFNLFEIGNQQALLVKATYIDVDTGEEKEYRLSETITVMD